MKVPSHYGSSPKSTACSLIAAGASWLLIVNSQALPAGTVVEGNLDVGISSSKGGIKIMGESGSTALPGLQITGDGGVVFVGTEGAGKIPATGAGVRLMWFPKLGAFRAGGVPGTEWDEANTGYYSNAFGYGNVASGNGAFAAGNYNIASGVAAIALGSGVTANSTASAVFGAFNIVPTASATAWVDGDPLFAIGNGLATNQRSTALMVKKSGVVNLYPFGSTNASIVLDPTGTTPNIAISGKKVVTSDSIGNIGVRAPATTSGITIGSASGANEIVFTNSGTDAAEIMHLGNANLVLGTNNMARLTVTGGGTVGIGIASPNATYKLDVADYSSLGGLRVNGNDEANTFLNTNGKQISINASAGSGITVKTTGAIVVGEWNTAAQQKFNVMGKSYFSDYVGIGTGAPSHELSVGSNAGTGTGTATPVSIGLGSTFGSLARGKNFKLRLFEAAGTGSTADYGLGISDSLFELTTGTGGDFAFFANGATPAELVRVKNNGNVGIGTASPSAKLEVAGSLKATGTVRFSKQGDIPMGQFGNGGGD